MSIKFYRYLFVLIALIILFPPVNVLAQEGKDGLVLRFGPGGYNSEVVPGESNDIFVEVANLADASTTDIQFTYDAPPEWTVEFKPSMIDTLNGGSYQTVNINVIPPKDAGKGNYSLTVIANSSIGQRVMTIFVRVEKGTSLWLWVGGILGVAAIALFVIFFRRMGRD